MFYLWGTAPSKSQRLVGPTLNTHKEGHSTWPVGRIFKKKYVHL